MTNANRWFAKNNSRSFNTNMMKSPVAIQFGPNLPGKANSDDIERKNGNKPFRVGMSKIGDDEVIA